MKKGVLWLVLAAFALLSWAPGAVSEAIHDVGSGVHQAVCK